MNTAIFDLIEQHKVDPAKVRTLRIGLSPTTFDLHGKLRDYKGKFDALISGHYTAAVILHDQKLTLAQFDAARYDDPKLRRAAADQVEIKPDPTLNGVQATAELVMADGRTLSSRCEHPRGSPENPLSRADRGQVPHLRARGDPGGEHRGSDRRGQRARGLRIGAQADGAAACASAACTGAEDRQRLTHSWRQ